MSGARHVYTDPEPPAGGHDAADAYVMFNNIPRVNDARRFSALLEGTAR